MASSQIQGMAEIRRKFALITDDLKYHNGKTALRKAANVIAKAARVNAKEHDDEKTGRQIYSNIAVQADQKLQKETGNVGMKIGVRFGAVSQKTNPDLGLGGPTWHWRFLELGTEKQVATPFLVPAMEQNASAAIDVFINEYDRALDKLLK